MEYVGRVSLKLLNWLFHDGPWLEMKDQFLLKYTLFSSFIRDPDVIL